MQYIIVISSHLERVTTRKTKPRHSGVRSGISSFVNICTGGHNNVLYYNRRHTATRGTRTEQQAVALDSAQLTFITTLWSIEQIAHMQEITVNHSEHRSTVQ